MNKLEEPQKSKIYKEKAIWVGTYLGGPLVSGYLFSQNFKSFGEKDKVIPTWIIAIVVTIGLFSLGFIMPENNNSSNYLLPIIYSVIALVLFKKFQEKQSDKHIKSGGQFYSWWRVIGISIIGLLITVIPIFGAVFTMDSLEQSQISTKSYGLTVKHEISFFSDNIIETEIDKIADGFRETGFFDLSVPKYVFAEKENNKYIISISVIEGIENDNDALEPFLDLRKQMDNYFPSKKIEFNLTVDYLDNIVKVLK